MYNYRLFSKAYKLSYKVIPTHIHVASQPSLKHNPENAPAFTHNNNPLHLQEQPPCPEILITLSSGFNTVHSQPINTQEFTVPQ